MVCHFAQLCEYEQYYYRANVLCEFDSDRFAGSGTAGRVQQQPVFLQHCTAIVPGDHLKDREKYTLLLILREILIEAQASEAMTDNLEAAQLQEVSEVLKYALIIVASVPMRIIYPFVQKYFVKGVMIGSLKG